MAKNKKTIKIDFRHYWGHFNLKNNLFVNLLKKDYNVVVDKEHPDYVFYSVYTHDRPVHSKTYGSIGGKIENFSPVIYRILRDIYYFKKERWKMPVISGNFVKIFVTLENTLPRMDKCDWAFSFRYDDEIKSPRHLRLPSYKSESPNLYKELMGKKDIEKIKKEKTKFCNYIYSNNVEFRNYFFKKLNRKKRVESWGKCCNNMGKLLPGRFDKNKKTEKSKGNLVWKPKEFLKQFKFTIAFESNNTIGFTTEKIVEAMSVNSIPIYWGNPLVHRDFNTKSFVNYHDFEREVLKKISPLLLKIPLIKILVKYYVRSKTTNKVIKRVMEIDQNEELYESYLKEPWFNDNKPTEYVKDEVIRKRLREIFG